MNFGDDTRDSFRNYVFRAKMNTILAELQEIGLTDGIRIKGQE